MDDWAPDDEEAVGRRIIGGRIRAVRLASAMSQRQLAWRTGLNQSTISRLERGTLTGMRLSTLARLEARLVAHHPGSFGDPPPAPTRRLPGMSRDT